MINGILNIYKEKGWTSHDVVARLRGIVGQKKIGHTGTLDPDAEGVLPVCLGRATKVCDLLTDKDKTYETVLLLGKTTDTQDISGAVLAERQTAGVTEEDVLGCIRSFIGEYDQIPPMYSALKVGGKKLYELAREGKTVERRSRKVLIHDIRVKEVFLPRVRMEVDCSKGTYIRTLCMISERSWAWEDAWSHCSAHAWEDSAWKRACGWQTWRTTQRMGTCHRSSFPWTVYFLN